MLGSKKTSRSASVPNDSGSQLAPIARSEEMSDDLSEETIVNGEAEVISSTPKKSWRLKGSLEKQGPQQEPPNDTWWSDEDDDEKTDRSAASGTINNCSDSSASTTNEVAVKNAKNHSSVNSVEDGFESFSCTDEEEDEGDQTSLDSNATSR